MEVHVVLRMKKPKWKRNECGCCWDLEDPQSTELLGRVTKVKSRFEVRVFSLLKESRSLKEGQDLAEYLLTKLMK